LKCFTILIQYRRDGIIAENEQKRKTGTPKGWHYVYNIAPSGFVA